MFANTMTRPRTFLRSLGLVLCVMGLLAGCSERAQAPNSTLVMLNKRKAQVADYKGKVLLVNFWATSCATCVEEMPDLAKLARTYKGKGVELVAVAMKYDPPSYVVRFQERHQLPFDVALDNTGAIAQEWGEVQLTPTTYLVNQQGEIVQTIVGAIDFESLRKSIDGLLEG